METEKLLKYYNEEEIEEFLDSYNRLLGVNSRWHYIKEPKLVRK